MPVAVDVGDADAPWRSLVERTDDDLTDTADEIAEADRVALILGNDPRDPAAGGADQRDRDDDRRERGDRSRQGTGHHPRDVLDQKPGDREGTERQQQEDQQRHAADIDPGDGIDDAIIAGMAEIDAG